MNKGKKKTKGVLAFISESPDFLKQSQDLKDVAFLSSTHADTHADEHAGKQSDTQTGRHTGEQSDTQTNKQAHMQADEYTGEQEDKQTHTQASEQSCIDTNIHADMHANKQPNEHVNTHADTHVDAHANIHADMHANKDKTARGLGLTENQLAFLQELAKRVYIEGTYESIGLETGFGSAGSVRGMIYRLFKRGFIYKKRIKIGIWTGVNIWIDQQTRKLIDSVSGNKISMQTCMQTPMQAGNHVSRQTVTQADTQGPPLKIDRKEEICLSKEEKTDEKLISLTNEDIAFHWPKLSKSGFGEHQIKQIVKRLSQVEKPRDYILQSLEYFEFEIEKGIKDKHGKEVEDLCSYIFNALAKNGYYRKPKGYISAVEQAKIDLDKELEVKKELKKKEEILKFEKDYEKWKEGLSEEEKETLRNNQPGKKDLNDRYLKSCFLKRKSG